MAGSTTDSIATGTRPEVEELSRWRRRLTIHASADRAGEIRRRAVRALAGKARLKGFRQGKAPERLIERQYGPQIDQQVLEDLVRESLVSALEQSGLDPIAMPDIQNVHWTAEGGLHFSAEFEIRPTIELGRTEGFRIEKRVRTVTDEDVDRVFERLRIERGEWRPADGSAATGHRVTFDSVPLDEAGQPILDERIENHPVELGADALLPDFEAGLTGLVAGTETSFDVRFPEDHPNEVLRGAVRRFCVTVHAVEERNLPELDDDFARSLGEFETLAAAREHIRHNLEAEVSQQAEREVNESLIDELIAANPIDLPESLVDRYLATMMADREGPLGGRVPAEREAEIRQLLRPGAERAMRRHAILTHIADRENLRVNDADVDRALAERGVARQELERAGQLDDFGFHLTMERVFGWLRERSTITSVQEDR